MELNYFLVNVPGKYGYSFMVRTEMTEDDEDAILDACLEQDLFDDEEDRDEASISIADEHDQQFFEDFYDIDD